MIVSSRADGIVPEPGAPGGLVRRNVQCEKPDRPRNPVLQVLVRFGRLISRGCTTAIPALRRLFRRGIHKGAFEKAHAAIDGSLRDVVQAIRNQQLDRAIEDQAEAVLALATRLVEDLRAQGALERPKGEDLIDSQIPDQALQIIEDRLARLDVSDEEIGALIRHLRTESLTKIGRRPEGSRIGKAIRDEVNTRPRRDVQEVRAQLRSLDAVDGTAFPDSPSPAELDQLTQNVEMALRSATAFNGPASKELKKTMEDVAPVIARASTSLAASLDASLAEARREAKQSIRAVGDILASRGPQDERVPGQLIVDLLPACKAMTRAVERHMAAPKRTLGATNSTPEFKTNFELLLGELLSDLEEPPEGMAQHQSLKIHPSLNSPAVRGVVEALKSAADQAGQAGLSELHGDLEHAWQALECLRELARKPGSGLLGTQELSRSKPLTDPHALDALKRHYCLAFEPGGQVRLTAGRCPKEFTDVMREVVQQPFSGADKATVRLPGGHEVPAQYVEDAQRTGTVFLDPDGMPLIDRDHWGTLSANEQQRRIEAGYVRLLAYYGGNETQTNTILQAANQTLVAAFDQASEQATDSPFVLEGFGPGRVNVTGFNGLNGTHETVVQFKTGQNHRPRVQMRYQVRGGQIMPPGHSGESTAVFLDLQRSWAGVTLEAQPNAAGTALELVGTPTYDVNLARNWAQCPYPAPDLALLLRRDLPLGKVYDDLIEYAADHQQEALPTLRAMQQLSGTTPGPESAPSIDAQLQELAGQLPDGLLESFIAYLPGHIKEIMEIDAQVAERQSRRS